MKSLEQSHPLGGAKIRRMNGPLAALLMVFSMLAPAQAGAKSFDRKEVSGHQLIEFLASGDWKLRRDAAVELGRRQMLLAEGELARLVNEDTVAAVRKEALRALGAMNSTRTLEMTELMVMFDDARSNRQRALMWLGFYGKDSSATALVSVLRGDDSAGLRRQAAQVLGRRRWASAIEFLQLAASDDEATSVRRAALRVLAVFGFDGLRQFQRDRLLADQDAGLRLELARRLSRKPTDEDIPSFLSALNDESCPVVLAISKGLVRMNDTAMAPVLREKALEVTDPNCSKGLNKAATALEPK